MPSVFPGMDPYLGAPWIWPDFNNFLAEAIRSLLISLTESLPVIAVPLLESESDVALNLQAAFQRTYDGGPYRRGAVDYRKPPFPSLNTSQEQWRMALMAAAD